MKSESLEVESPAAASISSSDAVVKHAFLLSVLTFVPSLLMALFVVATVSPEGGSSVASSSIGGEELVREFANGVIFMPLIETVLFHLLVIELLLKLRLRKTIYIVLIAAIPFFYIHIGNRFGLASAVSIIPGALVLPYCYIHWRRRTGLRRVAFAATWLTHGLHNLYFWVLNFVPFSVVANGFGQGG